MATTVGLRSREAADVLDVSSATIRRMIHTGRLIATKDRRGHFIIQIPVADIMKRGKRILSAARRRS
jgi:excisionase family DNA binding protein